METKSKRKEKEKVDVTRGKGIEFLSEITPTVTSEGTGDKPGVPDVTEDDSTESESESLGNDEDDSNNDDQDSKQEEESKYDDQEEEEFVHTPSPTNDKDDENLESESNETDKEVVQGVGVDAEMINAQQGIENLETTQEQVVEDAHVTISIVTNKTKVPATSSSCSSDLASKFLNFLDIPHTDELISA
ncbi:hypothetical protein Tco_1550095 [Tanacetum coccineum]